jgi:hypothetical protein
MPPVTVSKEVDGLQCHCNPMPEYPTGGRLMAELGDIAAPALAAIIPAIKDAGGDLDDPRVLAALAATMDANELLRAVGQALGRLAGDNPTRFERVTGELLRTVSVELPGVDGKIARVDLTTPAQINRVLQQGGGYKRLVKLLWFALGANFGNPFAGVFGGSPAAAAGTFREG